MTYWSEIKNQFFRGVADIDRAVEGAVLATVSIDAWKTDAEWEEGKVIASVILSHHGDVLVDYRDGIARTDEAAREAIHEAKLELRDYFLKLQIELEELNEIKNDKILYFGEGHFKTREELQDIAVASAEDFISRVYSSDVKQGGTMAVTYDFGSPFDELDLRCEYSEDTISWWTVCTLYTRGDSPDMTAVQSVESVTDINDIATTILELVEELDRDIEIEMVETMRSHLTAHEAVHSISEQENNKGCVLKATNIEWDVDCDEDRAFLPKEIEIPAGMNEDEISDYLSDVTGFCHKGYVLSNENNLEGTKNVKPSLIDQIQSASSRAAEGQSLGKMMSKESTPERS